MFNLPYNSAYFTCKQGHVQNPAGISSTWTKNFQMHKMSIDKTANQRSNCLHSMEDREREFQENIYFCFIDYAKASDCVDYTSCGKFLKKWEFQTTGNIHGVKKQQLEPHMGQLTGSKLGKKCNKSVYCHLFI